MWQEIHTRPCWMISRGMTTSCSRRIDAPFLEFSGEAGTLPTIRYLSGGKYRRTFIIRQVSWPPSFSVNWSSLSLHRWQTQVPLAKGGYSLLKTHDARDNAAASSAIFLVAFHLVRLAYFLGLLKSILTPSKIVPYLGFLADSSREVFHLIPEKKVKFITFLRDILGNSYVTVKTLQRLGGKSVSFSRAVPAARLFTREMNAAISQGLRSQKAVLLHGAFREEISHWLFLESWDDPLPWRDERHVQISVATDASASGWGATVISPFRQEMSGYWSCEELSWDIATKEAMAIHNSLLSCRDKLRNAQVDALVDNQAVVHTWNNQGGRSSSLNIDMKKLFATTMELNVYLHLSYIQTNENPAEEPSRRSSSMDCQLPEDLWQIIQKESGGPGGHTFDLMGLDSNARKDGSGNSLPHFTPGPSPGSSGVNLFAQDPTRHAQGPAMRRPYVFPPLILVGPVLRFLENFKQPCTIVVLDVYPRKYWWPLLQHRSVKVQILTSKGDRTALLRPSRQGWVPHPGIPGDLWAFYVEF